MRIDRYISSNRIIDLTSKDLKSAYAELVQTFDTPAYRPEAQKSA